MKSKFSSETLLLIKANKILKKHYSFLNRDLTRDEIIAEAKNALRKGDDVSFLVGYEWFFKLDKKEWQEIAALT